MVLGKWGLRCIRIKRRSILSGFELFGVDRTCKDGATDVDGYVAKTVVCSELGEFSPEVQVVKVVVRGGRRTSTLLGTQNSRRGHATA